MEVRVDLLVGGQRVGHHQGLAAGAGPAARACMAATSAGASDAPGHGVAGVGEVEAGEPVRAGSRPPGTESVSSRSRVAPTSRIDFTPAQTTTIGVARQRRQVGRLVEGARGAAVDAAQAAGGEDADARPGGQRGRSRRRSWRRRGRCAAARARSRRLSLATPSSQGDPLQRGVVQADPHHAVEHGDGGRDRAARRAPRPRSRAATRRLSGRGRPWAMMVDSSATTGRPSASAAATSVGTAGSSRCWSFVAGSYPVQQFPCENRTRSPAVSGCWGCGRCRDNAAGSTW